MWGGGVFHAVGVIKLVPSLEMQGRQGVSGGGTLRAAILLHFFNVRFRTQEKRPRNLENLLFLTEHAEDGFNKFGGGMGVRFLAVIFAVLQTLSAREGAKTAVLYLKTCPL